jgi:hypothetical protein
MERRPHLKRPEYDKGIAWIACHATPDTAAALLAYHADAFGQRHGDVLADFESALRVEDVRRGTDTTAAILAAIKGV